LPIRIKFEQPLPDHIAAILNGIQYATWNGPSENKTLIDELLGALQRPEAFVPQPPKLEPVGGAVPLDSHFYVVRITDEEFLTAICRRDSIVLVKGARQMGKTSLMARGLQKARENGDKVVLTDFQKLNTKHLESADSFFSALAESIADQLDCDLDIDAAWNPKRGASSNFERFLRREILPKVGKRLVWGMDEVDRLFTCNFASEVFGLFRSWHNERSLDPSGPWQKLTMAIAYATEAHMFLQCRDTSKPCGLHHKPGNGAKRALSLPAERRRRDRRVFQVVRWAALLNPSRLQRNRLPRHRLSRV
jgi:hypothetical protein